MSIEACADNLRKGDPDRFLAIMAAPADKRAPLFALYAFNLEVARAPWVSKEPMIAEMRLQFWRDTVEEAFEGKPARAHEVAEPLAAAIRDHDLPQKPFQQMIDARRWDIHRDPFEDAADFDQHLDHTSGNLMALSATVIVNESEDAARKVGYASGLANWLVAIPALESAGRIPLIDGRPEAIVALAEKGLAALDEARRSKPSSRVAPALRIGWLARDILQTAKKQPALVAEGGLVPSEFRKKSLLLYRSFTRGW